MKKVLLFLISLICYHDFIVGMDLIDPKKLPYASKLNDDGNINPKRSAFLDYLRNRDNDVTSNRFPYLCTAARCDDLEVVTILLSRPDVDVDAQNGTEQHKLKGRTPLGYACFNNNTGIAHVLLNAGANPNICTKETGLTPLHVAIEQQNTLLVQLLLNNAKTNPNIKTHHSMPPLHMAAVTATSEPYNWFKGNFDPLNYLLCNEKVDHDLKNDANQSFFYIALVTGYPLNSLIFFRNKGKEDKKLFLEQELHNLTMHFDNGEYNEDNSIIYFINRCIENGADITQKNHANISPLDSACNEFMHLSGHVSPHNPALILKKTIARLFLWHIPLASREFLKYHKTFAQAEDIQSEYNTIKRIHRQDRDKQLFLDFMI